MQRSCSWLYDWKEVSGKDQEPVFFSFNMIKKVACLMIDWRSANASNNWLRLLLFKCTVLTPHYQLIVQTQMIHYSRKTFRYLRCVKKFIYPEKGKIRQKFSGKKLQEVFFSVKAKCFSVFATPDPAAPCGCSTFRWKTVLDISFCSQMMETVALYNVIVDWNCFHGLIPLFNEK